MKRAVLPGGIGGVSKELVHNAVPFASTSETAHAAGEVTSPVFMTVA